jgi:hypothetical protein
MSRLLRRTAVAGLALAVLLGGLGAPLAGLLHADEEGAFCGTNGRCCCAGAQGASDRPCLRRACGCDRPEPATVHAPMCVEAVLPLVARLFPAEGARVRPAAPAPRPFDRPDEPVVPPPRGPRPA